MISLDGVRKAYRRGRREIVVLDGASLSVESGDYVGIFGGPGSGKSTLMLLCGGLVSPDGGVVRYRGRDLRDFSDREKAELWRDQIGLVSRKVAIQSTVRRVVDHVATPLVSHGWNPEAGRAAARETLNEVGAGNCPDALLDELSPGEHTLVEIARALVRDPELLLIDEPESTPSREESDRIRKLLSELGRREGLTLVVASANPGAMPGARRFLSISDGRLLSEADKESNRVVPLNGQARVGRPTNGA